MSFIDDNYDKIFKKYSDEELIKDINNYLYKNGNLSKVLNHFFKENIYNSVGGKYKYSPMYVLQNDEIVEKILQYCRSKPKFYNGNDVQNIESYFRNGGNYARKVANFSPITAYKIYTRYTDSIENKNILDTSCGFGSRMLAALLHGANYYGFEPNKETYNSLKNCYAFLMKNNIIKQKQICQLYNVGSEIFIQDVCGKIDLSFTSPPYFNLEYYGNDGFSSTNNINDYDMWIKEFAIPTIKNTNMYAKNNCICMINIKNLNSKGKQKLYDDWKSIFLSIKSFKLHEEFEINHQSKRNFNIKNYNGFKEPVMSFIKI